MIAKALISGFFGPFGGGSFGREGLIFGGGSFGGGFFGPSFCAKAARDKPTTAIIVNINCFRNFISLSSPLPLLTPRGRGKVASSALSLGKNGARHEIRRSALYYGWKTLYHK
jgi:hypothetical protein